MKEWAGKKKGILPEERDLYFILFSMDSFF